MTHCSVSTAAAPPAVTCYMATCGTQGPPRTLNSAHFLAAAFLSGRFATTRSTVVQSSSTPTSSCGDVREWRMCWWWTREQATAGPCKS